MVILITLDDLYFTGELKNRLDDIELKKRDFFLLKLNVEAIRNSKAIPANEVVEIANFGVLSKETILKNGEKKTKNKTFSVFLKGGFGGNFTDLEFLDYITVEKNSENEKKSDEMDYYLKIMIKNILKDAFNLQKVKMLVFNEYSFMEGWR